MASTTAPFPPGGGDGAVLDTAEFGRRIGVGRVATVRELCADQLVPGSFKPGHDWRIHWPTFYAAVAGPGVADGPVVGAREMAAMLGVSPKVLRGASGPPGTPEKLPCLALGRQRAKICLYALAAVQPHIDMPLPGLDGPGTPPAVGQQPAASAPAGPEQPAGPPAVRFLAPPLEHPAGVLLQPPAAPGRANGGGRGIRRRPSPPAAGRGPVSR